MVTDATSEKETREARQWATLVTDLFETLIGKGAEVAYNFQNLQIEMPRIIGPEGSQLGSAKWVINGRVTIIAQSDKAK
jgi:hypothetical protein